MKLVVVSHKDCWVSQTDAPRMVTDGGFPDHMLALAGLFDAMEIVVPVDQGSPPAGLRPLPLGAGVVELTRPRGDGLRRKLNLIPWFLRNGPRMVRAIWGADGVHVPIPGDIGTLGILVALILRKPLYVRHCGDFARTRTTAERFWRASMIRLAGGRNVMMATGGGDRPPSARNEELTWIFSSSLSQADLDSLARERGSPREPWQLITACRLVERKGVDRCIATVEYLVSDGRDVSLTVVGDGPARQALEARASVLGDRVSFTGRLDRPEVVGRMGEADLFLYPTEANEGFPKVVLEALATGLPVVSSPISVIPHLVGAAGTIVPLDASPQVIATAIALILDDAARYRACSTEAVAQVSGYSLERWTATIGDRLERAWGPLRGADQ